MEKNIKQQTSRTPVQELTKMGVIAALYIAITLAVAPVGFGPIQFRLSEMFNYLALFHKRYVIAVTIGVVIVNFFSPFGLIDVVVGGLSTFLVLVISRAATKRMKNLKAKMVVMAAIVVVSMFTIAGQIYFISEEPESFWFMYLTIAGGQLVSMTIGGVIIYIVNKKIDFSK
ncbi:QueT transporter family protein [Amphibacillus indicireducens]|uniref:QueT transporter family protein n=1 Tax=Amphibacillus indicireducens TaxID=1076330 RepID=A0ABP7VQ55_9BACI